MQNLEKIIKLYKRVFVVILKMYLLTLLSGLALALIILFLPIIWLKPIQKYLSRLGDVIENICDM